MGSYIEEAVGYAAAATLCRNGASSLKGNNLNMSLGYHMTGDVRLRKDAKNKCNLLRYLNYQRKINYHRFFNP